MDNLSLSDIAAVTNKSEARTIQYGDSDFLKAVSNADISKVLKVINEHMEVIKLLYPKEYDAIIEKISN